MGQYSAAKWGDLGLKIEEKSWEKDEICCFQFPEESGLLNFSFSHPFSAQNAHFPASF